MAIPADPHRSQIKSEFGTATLAAEAPNGGLLGMYDSVFANTNFSRDAFVGKAKATITSLMGVSISTNTVTLDVDITAGGVNTEVIGQYQLANSQATPDPNNWSTLASTTVSTDGNVSVSATIPDGTYFFQMTVYNGFISHVDERLTENTGDDTERFDVDVAPPVLATPVISSGTAEYNGNDGYLSFTYNDPEDAFVVEVRVDGSSTETATIDCTNANVGTSSNPKELRFNWTNLPNTSAEFRVKATASGYTDSGWSGWKTATSVPLFQLPSCPL